MWTHVVTGWTADVLFLRQTAVLLLAPSSRALAAAAAVHQRLVPSAAWAEGEVEGLAWCRVCCLAAVVGVRLFLCSFGGN